jgi:TPR repeat protein
MEKYYECCGKSICVGCIHSFAVSGNYEKCPFCKAVRIGKTDNERVEELMKRVAVNDAGATCLLGSYYREGIRGVQQDYTRAMELYARAADLGYSQAHYNLAVNHQRWGDLKKALSHYEAAAMAGHEVARYNLGYIEAQSGNMERAFKHWMIAASAGDYSAMRNILVAFNHGSISRNAIDSTLTAYNTSCAEMRSEAREACIQIIQ